MAKTNTNEKMYRLQIFNNLIVDEKFGMPIIKKYEGEKPTKLQAFNKAVTEKQYENFILDWDWKIIIIILQQMTATTIWCFVHLFR